MKKNDFLQDAIGLIREDYILEADNMPKKFKRSKSIAMRVCAAVACFAVAVTAMFWPVAEEQSGKVAENIWEKDNFHAYTLIYGAEETESATESENTTESENFGEEQKKAVPISISLDGTIKIEAILAERYVIYYSQEGTQMFYDLQEDEVVDLEERVIGHGKGDLTLFINTVFEAAKEKYPGMVDSKKNQEILREVIENFARHRPFDIEVFDPDTAFISELEEYQYTDPKEYKNVFFALCGELCGYAFGELPDEYIDTPYCIEIFGVDETNGQCLLLIRDIQGNGETRYLYNIETDELVPLKDSPGESLLSLLFTDGYIVRFSENGRVATIAQAAAGFYGGNLYLDLTQRYIIPSVGREVWNYQGENIGVIYFDSGATNELNEHWEKASSEGYISDSGNVIYYRQVEEAATGHYFRADDLLWFNRLDLYSKDTDYWIFCTMNPNNATCQSKVTVQGNFVRFIGEESAVIMEKDGGYKAYSLEDGREVTEEIIRDSYPRMSHERLRVYCENGKVYKEDLFAREPATIIALADEYIMSKDGAFVFTYCYGNDYVTCTNIVTLENCQISIEKEMCEQLLQQENAIFRMTYNEEDNSLLCSFYIEGDESPYEESGVDFFEYIKTVQSILPEDEEFWR